MAPSTYNVATGISFPINGVRALNSVFTDDSVAVFIFWITKPFLAVTTVPVPFNGEQAAPLSIVRHGKILSLTDEKYETDIPSANR